MPGGASGSDGPTVSLSFANNFWGKDDAGVGPLLEHMHHAKVTGSELKDFYHARAALEEEYAKKLLGLARKPLGSAEAGTLRMSLDVVRGEVESMGKAHQHIAQQMRGELEEPLSAFTGGINERRKLVQNGIEKLLKTKNQQTAAVHKTRDRFEQDCLKIKGYLAQGHMVMGQEERRNKAKLEKTQIQMSSNSSEYEAAVKVLEETTGRWNREWKAACDKFQDLEEERLDYFKSSLWSFANIASTVCVSDDQSCEKIRLSLEDCEVEKDISTFIRDCGTGQEIPDPPKYINFCRGDVDDVGSNHESDDGHYAVAQFQRVLNPTYRTSSPQPSTFESHHDPDSRLRDEMGIPKNRATSIQPDDSFTSRARTSHGSAAAAMPPPPLTASNVSSAPSNPYADAPHVPHNPYPADGMTQFCRLGPPSERSSVPSPARPGSRDSTEHSDYSAPTSFSSTEPTSAAASPTKGYNGSNISAVSSMSGMSSGHDEKTIQKKKSGFFNSPFKRRASARRKEEPPSAAATPSGRNTWTPATVRKTESAHTSPVKPFGTAGRASTWNKPPSVSPDADVDARADYQLGIGTSTFELTHPSKKPSPRTAADDELDPIAQALAELKGVTKQASTRESADRHYGMSTPAPGTPAGRGMPGGGGGAGPLAFAGHNHNHSRATPPPAYDPPVSRLGAPPPAHTKREMQKTAEQYASQKRHLFHSAAPSRPGSSMGGGGGGGGGRDEATTRAASPQPPRATSPRPLHNGDRPTTTHPHFRAASPNPYGGGGGGGGPAARQRPRAQSSSPVKAPSSHYGSSHAARGGSPGYPVARATSPNPAYIRPATSGGGGGGGAMMLAPAGPNHHHPPPPPPPQQQQQLSSARVRSHSPGPPRPTTHDGRPILHYARAMYMYQAAIPEELSFAKGDVLAVTRHQDDGWWEAEVVTRSGVLGLVPSNYLKAC